MGSFFATLKCELARQQARGEILEYIEGFYNRHRRHSALGYVSPEAHQRLYEARSQGLPSC